VLKVLLGDGTKTGKRLLLLGLTPENVGRLRAGQPILVDADKLGLPDLRIALCYGESINDIANDVRIQLGVDLPYIPEPESGEEWVMQTKPPAGG
jgi:hypothetical protein